VPSVSPCRAAAAAARPAGDYAATDTAKQLGETSADAKQYRVIVADVTCHAGFTLDNLPADTADYLLLGRSSGET
jgi:hypothetical protein